MAESMLGGFTIRREIGRGGMAIVYEAQQSDPARLVALKVLPPELGHIPSVAERFKREANRIAGLDAHPGIATVYVAEEDNGQPFLAMQLLLGGDLESRLAREGRIEPLEAARIAATIAQALDHAHQHGVIHRDIKPANIMFDASGRPVLTDFGIATAADEMRMTQTGMAVCTPEYASPEQLKGNPVDGRSDIYSLGVVLYRMVCGSHPFHASTPMAVAMKQLSETPPLPRAFYPDIPLSLEQIIWSCMAREPSERYATAGQLAAALQAFASGHNMPAVTRAVQPDQHGSSTHTTLRQRMGPSPTVVFAVSLAAFLGIGLILGAGILLGQWTGPGPGPRPTPMPEPIPTPGDVPPPPPPPPPDEQTIRLMQERWRSSWVHHDLDAHVSCFWPEASIDGMSRTRYRAYQAREFTRQPEMEVIVDDLVVSTNGDTAVSKFSQHFHGRGPSSDYESQGRVTHIWSRRNGEWRIIREDFVKVWSRGH